MFDDEDDDSYIDEVAEFFFGSQVRCGAAMVPLAGQVATAEMNTYNDKPYDDRISTPPVWSAWDRVVRAPFKIYDAVTDDGSARMATQDGLPPLATILGIPTGQLSKIVGYGIGGAFSS